MIILEWDSTVSKIFQKKIIGLYRNIFCVTALSLCHRVLRSQKKSPLLILAGKPPTASWSEWRDEVLYNSSDMSGLAILALDSEGNSPRLKSKEVLSFVDIAAEEVINIIEYEGIYLHIEGALNNIHINAPQVK